MTNPHLTLVAPTTVIGTVGDRRRPPHRKRNAEVRAREYLTDAEVNRLIVAAGKNRYGHRDATMVLVAYRHGLRPWPPAREPGQERLAERSPPVRPRAAGLAPVEARAGAAVALHLHFGARRAAHHCRLPQADRSAWP